MIFFIIAVHIFSRYFLNYFSCEFWVQIIVCLTAVSDSPHHPYFLTAKLLLAAAFHPRLASRAADCRAGYMAFVWPLA